MTPSERVIVALLDGGVLRARKHRSFGTTTYALVRVTYDEATGTSTQREQFEVKESTVRSLARKGLLDASEAIKTFTENRTEYSVTLSDLGVSAARSVGLSEQEVSRAG